MIAAAEGAPPARDACSHSDSEQSNETEALDSSNNDRVRLIAKWIGVDSAGGSAEARSLGSFRIFRRLIRSARVVIGGSAGLVQRKSYRRAFHRAPSWT